MSSDPIEVLRKEATALLRAAEGCNEIGVIQGKAATIASLCRFALASLSAPKPESAEAVCPECHGEGGRRWYEADGSERGERCGACDGFGTAPPRPEASDAGTQWLTIPMLAHRKVPESYRDQADGYRAGWNDAIHARAQLSAPQQASARVGVEGVLADLETIWHSVSDDKQTNAAYERLKIALAQQPAAVDEATRRDAERYRYLRRPEAWKENHISERGASAIFIGDGRRGEAKDGEALDAAIDRILAGQQP